MHFTPSITILPLLLALSAKSIAIPTNETTDLIPRAPKGINCKGSIICFDGPLLNLLSYALDSTDGCPAGPGEHMYCDDHICAFTQDTGRSISEKRAKQLLQSLADYGCKGCGSVPLNYPESNNAKDGIFTVNYVSDHHMCYGPCRTGCVSAI